MNKGGVILLVLSAFLLIGLINFSNAANCTSFQYSNWSSCDSGTQIRSVLNSTPSGCTGGFPEISKNCTVSSNSGNSGTTASVNLTNLQKGFKCLEEQTKPDCSGATTVQEIALTIMAVPNNTKNCVTRLESFKKNNNCFGTSACTVKETAMAILALNHVGKQTTAYTDWLKNQTRISEDIIWQFQQDSEGAASCEMAYDAQEFGFNVQENKKIDSSAGACFNLVNSNFWFQISPNCYQKEFTITCDKDFASALMYKNQDSQVLYLLSDTKTATANTPVNFKVKSKCFGTSTCDYEASLWAIFALDKTGNPIDEYTPYLIAAEDSNKRFLPSAFLHILVDFAEYGAKLLKLQTLNSWEAEGSPYGKYYDTSIALIALSDNSNQVQVANAQKWLLNTAQGQNGCWNNNNVRDTAIALWALGQRTANFGGTQETRCTDANFKCLIRVECPDADRLPNYIGCSSTQACCKNVELKTCSQLGGVISCGSGKQCSAAEEKSSDGMCCTGTCEATPPSKTECELDNGQCRTSCRSNEDKIESECDSGNSVCCKASTTTSSEKSLLWLWILLIVLIILIALAIIFRDKLQMWWFKVTHKVNEERGNASQNNIRPGFSPTSRPPMMGGQMAPSRPGMVRTPTVARPLQPQPRTAPSVTKPSVVKPTPVKKTSDDDDVFKKLKDMGK
jgi:hypothetical protein